MDLPRYGKHIFVTSVLWRFNLLELLRAYSAFAVKLNPNTVSTPAFAQEVYSEEKHASMVGVAKVEVANNTANRYIARTEGIVRVVTDQAFHQIL